MIREWTPSQTHNISVSGKSGKTTYNASLGYLDQNGLMKLAKHDDFPPLERRCTYQHRNQ